MMNDLSQFLLVLLLTPVILEYAAQRHRSEVAELLALIAVIFYDCTTVDMHATGFQLFLTMGAMSCWAVMTVICAIGDSGSSSGKPAWWTAMALLSYLLATRTLMVLF